MEPYAQAQLWRQISAVIKDPISTYVSSFSTPIAFLKNFLRDNHVAMGPQMACARFMNHRQSRPFAVYIHRLTKYACFFLRRNGLATRFRYTVSHIQGD